MHCSGLVRNSRIPKTAFGFGEAARGHYGVTRALGNANCPGPGLPLMGEQIALADINAGFDRLATGHSLRDVVVF